MKCLLIFVVVVIFSNLAKAEVKISSFYFDENGIELVGSSRCQLDELQQLQSTHDVQIIEINSFSSINGDKAASIKLAKQRLKLIVDILGIDEENAICNIYGNQKIELNFTPSNWHRVDIYFYLGARREAPSIEVMEHSDIVALLSPDIKTMESDTDAHKVNENKPFILPISFVGGTNEIQRNSYAHLEELYQTLHSNQNLRAHIRGHVCCGNNPMISKKRAKVVYKYLRQKGISKTRLSFKGYSNSQPRIFPEVSDEDRRANRRVDVVFTEIKVKR